MTLTGEEVRLISQVLIEPYLYGGKATILIENRLPRGREFTDTLYMIEMLKVWQEKDRHACPEKLFDAYMKLELQPDASKLRALKTVFGMNERSIQPTS